MEMFQESKDIVEGIWILKKLGKGVGVVACFVAKWAVCTDIKPGDEAVKRAILDHYSVNVMAMSGMISGASVEWKIHGLYTRLQLNNLLRWYWYQIGTRVHGHSFEWSQHKATEAHAEAI